MSELGIDLTIQGTVPNEWLTSSQLDPSTDIFRFLLATVPTVGTSPSLKVCCDDCGNAASPLRQATPVKKGLKEGKPLGVALYHCETQPNNSNPRLGQAEDRDKPSAHRGADCTFITPKFFLTSEKQNSQGNHPNHARATTETDGAWHTAWAALSKH